MNDWTIGILIAAAFAALVFGLVWWRKRKRIAEAWKAPTGTRCVRIMQRVEPVMTPGNVPVYFEEGVPRDIDLSDIDYGINRTFEKMACMGYTVDRSLYRPKIVMLNSELSPETRTPSFRVWISNLSPYYNSEWDMAPCDGEHCDHWVLAAGQVTHFGHLYGDVLAIPYPHGDREFLKLIIEFEWEHVGYAYVDGPKFEETKTHGVGQGHPIMPECIPTGARGFASPRPFKGLCLTPQK